MLKDKKTALAAVQQKVTNITTAIAMGGNIAILVETLTTLEAGKPHFLTEIDKLQ